MTYAFHDLAHIILSYLDDLTLIPKNAHNTSRIYKSSLNVVEDTILTEPPEMCLLHHAGRLLGFIISQQGITIDPLKV
jgi:hypothetical protein